MILEQKSITSVEVAEMVGKDHKNILRDIRGYMDDLTELKIEPSDFFKNGTYQDANNQPRPCYFVSKRGCEFIGNKLTGIKGTEFTAKYINRFHDMEEIIKKPLTEREMPRIQLSMIDDVEQRVEKLENTMTIDYGQQQVIKERVNSIVIHWLGGKESFSYKEIAKKVFSECNRDFQKYFNVNSRNNTPKMKFDDAVYYLAHWEPCMNTKLEIQGCNAQMSLGA